MKLNRRKLRQLIKEEYRNILKEMTRDEHEFKKRRQKTDSMIPGTRRVFGDESQEANPDFAGKLTKLYQDYGEEERNQALDLADTLDEPIDVPLEKLTFDVKDEYAMDWEKDKIEDQISYLFQKYGYVFYAHDIRDKDELSEIKDLVKQGFIIDDVGNEDFYRGKRYYFNDKKIQYHIFKKARMMLMDNKTYFYDDVLKMLRHFESLELIDCEGDCLYKLEELSGNYPL